MMSPDETRTFLTGKLLGPRPDLVFRKLSEEGELGRLLPEVEALHGVRQPPAFHPEGDVFEHTMLMLSHMAWKTEALGWSILLHDIGKPACLTITSDGTPHFYGHEAVGAVMAEEILTRLNMIAPQKSRIVHAVKNHMRMAHVERMRKNRLDRLIGEPDFSLDLELNRIDCISSNGLLGCYVLLLDRMAERKEEEKNAPPPCYLTGRDLLDLRMRPGPEFKRILDECVQLQKEKRLTSRSDALLWLKKNSRS